MPLKYPIILVHGIILKDIKFIKAFGRIEKNLRSSGNICYTSKTDGFGTTSSNALMLKKQIDEILVKHNTTKVNLICHSKGGLDAKYLIKNYNYEDKIASYITISTPHKGSILADKILTLPKFITKLLSVYLNFIYRIFGDKNPNSYQVCVELSEENVLNNDYLMSDKIFALSYSASIAKMREDFILGIPLKFFYHYQNLPNDGAVSVESASYMNYQGNISGISHREIAGFMVSKKRKERVYAFYNEIVKKLEEQGL